LTIIANNLNKLQGTTDPTLTYSVNGLKFTDTAATTLSGALDRAPGEASGKYAIGQGSLALQSNNYTLSYTPGELTIRSVPKITTRMLSELVGTTLIAPDNRDKNRGAHGETRYSAREAASLEAPLLACRQ
jgi:hypothetical protein